MAKKTYVGPKDRIVETGFFRGAESSSTKAGEKKKTSTSKKSTKK